MVSYHVTRKERRGEACEELNGARARLPIFNALDASFFLSRQNQIPSLLSPYSPSASLSSLSTASAAETTPKRSLHSRGNHRRRRGKKARSKEKEARGGDDGIDPFFSKTHQKRSCSSQDRLLARVPRFGPRDDAKDRVFHLAHGVSGASAAARSVASERRRVAAHASTRAAEGRASGSPARRAAAVSARAGAKARRRRRAPELVHSREAARMSLLLQPTKTLRV